MKNTVKKIIALVIAILVLVLPMVVSAADYDENNQIALSLGTEEYTVSKSYNYSIFSFEPEEEAEYTFTAENKLMGIVSYNGMWVTVEPSDTTITEKEVVWTCTGVGQSLWIAVKTNKTSSVSVTVTKKTEEKEEEISWTIYQNVHTPTPFTFEGDASKLEYVDTEDGVDDRPTLGEDGYYHFGSENGPILYADLDDSMMNLVDAQSYGQIKYIGYDGDTIVTKIDFYDAFEAYAKAADKNTMLYPLTEDLIQIYKLAGQYHGWYGDDGWVGGNDEDCWMFACYYDPAGLEDDKDDNIGGGNQNNNDQNGGNSDSGNNNSGNNSGNATGSSNSDSTNKNENNTSKPIPPTGDSAVMSATILLLAFSAAALVVLKRKLAA